MIRHCCGSCRHYTYHFCHKGDRPTTFGYDFDTSDCWEKGPAPIRKEEFTREKTDESEMHDRKDREGRNWLEGER